jgi:uncharacterized protein DUF1549
MIRQRFWLLGLIGLFAAVSTTTGADIPTADANVQALAAQIDKRIAAGWSAARAETAPLADDAEFLRRVYLDLAGRIPTVTESRAFLDDGAADKRLRLIDSLLARPSYARHFANFWRSQWLSEVKSSFIGRFLAPGFERWIRSRLDEGAGYDQMVRELLTTPVDRARQALNDLYSGQSSTPVAFIIAKESKAEILAGSTARMFLGVRLECAQCHDHPFATWKREAFWGWPLSSPEFRPSRPATSLSPRASSTNVAKLPYPAASAWFRLAFSTARSRAGSFARAPAKPSPTG